MRLGGLCRGASSTFFSMACTTVVVDDDRGRVLLAAVHHAVADARDLLHAGEDALRRVGERLPHELHGRLVVRDLHLAQVVALRASSG